MNYPHLTVDFRGLHPTLRKVLAKMRHKRLQQVVLSYDGGYFQIDFKGAQFGAKAVGEWKGSCRVSMRVFDAIVSTHQGDTLELAYRDGKLKIGTTSVSAHWEDISAKLIELSIDTPEADFLGICLSVPEARVTSSGLGPRFRDATSRLAKRVDAAADALKAYGDFRAAIEAIVVEDLKRRGREAE